MNAKELEVKLEQEIANLIAAMPEKDGIKVTFTPRTENGWQTLTANGKTLMMMAGVSEGTSRNKVGGNGIFSYVMDFMCKSKTTMRVAKKSNLEIAEFLFNRAVHEGTMEQQRAKDTVIRAEAEKGVQKLREEFGGIADTNMMQLSAGVKTDVTGKSEPIIRVKLDNYFTVEQVRQLLTMIKEQS